MAVRIRTTDGKEIVVKGTLGEVEQHLIARWATLAEFELNGKDARVLVSTQQITSAAEATPATVTVG